MTDLTKEQRFQLEKEELEKRLETITELPPANIMVAGITGTGKSTLINAVFGSELAKTGTGRPVTEHIDEYQQKDMPIHIWDTVGLELDSEKTKESIKSIKDTIAKKASSVDQTDRVHAIWYCINSGSKRYQGAELEFIKELHDINIPFIIVLTQCYGAKKNIEDFKRIIKEINHNMGMDDILVMPVLAQDFEVEVGDNIIPIKAFGLEDLVNETLKQLPSFIKAGFVAAQRVCQDQKRVQCEEVIYEFVYAAKIGFWDRVPLINIFTTDKNIRKMVTKIGQLYNTVLTEKDVRRIIEESGLNVEDVFRGLISPFYKGYSDRINRLLEEKKEKGFDVKIKDVENKYRAAKLIAFYGYTFIDSLEELWKQLTEQQLKNVDIVVDKLIKLINERLRHRFGGNDNKRV